jgi:hypothetical protein
VSSFLDADFEGILALRPDLVIGFSDLQGDIARELARRGVPVLVTNQRSVSEILQTIRAVTAMVGRGEEGAALARALEAQLARVAEGGSGHSSKKTRSSPPSAGSPSCSRSRAPSTSAPRAGRRTPPRGASTNPPRSRGGTPTS